MTVPKVQELERRTESGKYRVASRRGCGMCSRLAENKRLESSSSAVPILPAVRMDNIIAAQGIAGRAQTLLHRIPRKRTGALPAHHRRGAWPPQHDHRAQHRAWTSSAAHAGRGPRHRGKQQARHVIRYLNRSSAESSGRRRPAAWCRCAHFRRAVERTVCRWGLCSSRRNDADTSMSAKPLASEQLVQFQFAEPQPQVRVKLARLLETGGSKGPGSRPDHAWPYAYRTCCCYSFRAGWAAWCKRLAEDGQIDAFRVDGWGLNIAQSVLEIGEPVLACECGAKLDHLLGTIHGDDLLGRPRKQLRKRAFARHPDRRWSSAAASRRSMCAVPLPAATGQDSNCARTCRPAG